MNRLRLASVLVLVVACGETNAAGDAGSVGAPDAAVDAAVEPATPDSGAADAGRVMSAGCGNEPGLAEGEHAFELEGRERRFIVRLPSNYNSERAWPLVLALHPNGGSATYWDATAGQRNLRGMLAENAILVIAEAIGGNWRDYDAPAETWPAAVDSELRYFDEVLTQVRSALCIDETAIFAMGFSGGGSFSGVLGCRRSDIAAIAAGGAVMYYDPASCVGTPAAWVTIGAEEQNPGRSAFRDDHRNRAGCDEATEPTDPSPCVSYRGCQPAHPVHYCEHEGGHVWPDFGVAAAWQFFAQRLAP